MATGRLNQLTKQIGEYLVAAELGRFGLIASTFSGSVPDYDIIATDSEFSSVPVQVKAITGTSWQFDLRRFVSVSLDGKKQIVGDLLPLSRDIVCVMIALSRYGSEPDGSPLNGYQKQRVALKREALGNMHGGR